MTDPGLGEGLSEGEALESMIDAEHDLGVSGEEEISNERADAVPASGPLPRKTIRARQTALHNPMMMDAMRRTRLGLKGREVTGKLTFTVPKGKGLVLPPTQDDASPTAAAREALCRRFASLSPSRREDDGPYFDAIDKGTIVNLVTALPPDCRKGGWRCHAKSSSATSAQGQCLHANRAGEECCGKCQSPKPNLREEFAYLRLLPMGMRRQRREYERIIKDCDGELERCAAAEREATERIAAFERSSAGSQEEEVGDASNSSDTVEASVETIGESSEAAAEDEDLMMDLDMGGTWQRVDARSLLPILAERKISLSKRLGSARMELAIMIQAAYDLAVPHVQKVARRFLVRLHLDEIRRSVHDFARFSAAVEIQRIMRSKLACREALRQRTLRDNVMATMIQAAVRRRFAVLERQRLHAIYMEKLRNRSATIIQSLYRCHACKVQAQLLAEEKRRQMEEQEMARVASLEQDSAIVVQKHWRRCLAIDKCANRRVELGLHRRLLMYLERYVVDGCLWTFVKSINDDYLRYERTITHTIEREEKMAKTFVEKVINARDGDHSKAWESYLAGTNGDGDSNSTRKNVVDCRKGLGKQDNHHNAMRIYGSPPRHRFWKSHTKKVVRPKSDVVQLRSINGESSDETSSRVESKAKESHPSTSYELEAKQLSSLQHIKDRLRGQYLRFDIPDGLDDTVSRFITAVALRYKFDTPGDSKVHGNFESIEQRSAAYAEPLIQQLHGKGIVFIRDLLPAENMAHTMSSMGVTKEFLVIANSLLNVLHQITGGNRLERKYLMMSARHLLNTQKRLRESGSDDAKSDSFNLASFLSECGGAGCDSYDDDDNPGGIWKPKVRRSTPTHETCQYDRVERPPTHLRNSTRKRSWVVPYAAKIISQNESKHPALRAYRQGQLLDRRSSNNA